MYISSEYCVLFELHEYLINCIIIHVGRDNFGFQEKKKSKHENIEKKKAGGCQRDQVGLQEEAIKGENANAKPFQYSISFGQRQSASACIHKHIF